MYENKTECCVLILYLANSLNSFTGTNSFEEFFRIFYVKDKLSLAGWLHWLEHHPIHQNVADLTPSPGTYLGCRFDPVRGV